MAADLHISLQAETIFQLPLGPLGTVDVTNSMFTGWLVTLIVSLVLLSIIASYSKKPNGVQILYESIYGFLYGLIRDVLGEPLASKVFPLMLSLFLFILFGSFAGLLPWSGSVGYYEEIPHEEKVGVPIFRAVTADINTALALALVSFFVIEYYGFKQHGFRYLSKFFNFANPLNFFVGILEFISEIMRIITFSFRLFGNIFAGEVIIAVMLWLSGWYLGFAGFPFLAFEVFVCVVQALVFVMLTTVFISLAVEPMEHH